MTFTLTYWRGYLRQGTFYDSTVGVYRQNYYPYGSEDFATFPPQLDTVYRSLPIARQTAPPGWMEPPVVPPPTVPDKPVAGGVKEVIAAANVTGDKVIAVRNNRATMADRSLDYSLILGVGKNSAAIGEVVEVVTSGEAVNDGWSWVVGQPVFLGAAPGELTQGEVSNWACQVGVATASNEIEVRVEPPIKLV